MPPRRSRWLLAPLLGACLLGGACSTDSEHRRDEPPAPEPDPPRFESRVGVPILMDIPVIGFLFCRHTVVR